MNAQEKPTVTKPGTRAQDWRTEAQRALGNEGCEPRLRELEAQWETERERAVRWRATPTHPMLWQGDDGRCAWDVLSENTQARIAPWLNVIDTQWVPAHMMVRGLDEDGSHGEEVEAALDQRTLQVGPRMVAVELKPELGPSSDETIRGVGQWLRKHRATIDAWRWLELCAGRDGRRWSAKALEGCATARGDEARCAASALANGEDDEQGCSAWLRGWPAELAKKTDATLWTNAILGYAIRRHDVTETLRAFDEGATLGWSCDSSGKASAQRMGTWDNAPIALVAKLTAATLEWDAERVLASAGAHGNEGWMRALLSIERTGTGENSTSRRRIRRWARALRRGAIGAQSQTALEAVLRATPKNAPEGDDLLDAMRTRSVEIARIISEATLKRAGGREFVQAFRHAAGRLGRSGWREGCADPERQAVLRTVAEVAAATGPGLRNTLPTGVFGNDWGWITKQTGEAPIALYANAGPDAVLEPSDPAWQKAIEAMEEACPSHSHPGLYAEQASNAVAQALGRERLERVRLVRSDETLGEESGAAVACAIGRAQMR